MCMCIGIHTYINRPDMETFSAAKWKKGCVYTCAGGGGGGGGGGAFVTALKVQPDKKMFAISLHIYLI